MLTGLCHGPPTSKETQTMLTTTTHRRRVDPDLVEALRRDPEVQARLLKPGTREAAEAARVLFPTA